MKDRWKRRDGSQWNVEKQIRFARRFRGHVRTASHPNGRIHRELCFNHLNCGASDPARSEAHHLKYETEDDCFIIIWACFSCHRKLDHGSLKSKKKDVWNYNSLVIKNPAQYAERRPPEGILLPEDDIVRHPLDEPF